MFAVGGAGLGLYPSHFFGITGVPGICKSVVAEDVVAGSGPDGVFDAVGGVWVGDALGLGGVELCDGCVVFPSVVGETVMPQNVVLHESNSFTLDGIGDYHDGLVAVVAGSCFTEGAAEGGVVVPVDFKDAPPECFPFGCEVLEFEGVLVEVEALHMVVVNDCHEIVEPEMVGEKRGLPDGALVALAVAEDNKHAPGAAVFLSGVGHARTYAKAMPEGAGGKVDAWKVVGNMAREATAVLIMGLELPDREKSGFGEGGIDACAGMAFAEDEAVAVVPGGIEGIVSQDFGVQHGHYVGDGENGPEVGSAGEVGHLHTVAADEPCKLFTGVFLSVFHIYPMR